MSFSKKPGRRVMICVRGVCAPPEQGKALEKQLTQLIEAAGVQNSDHPQHVRCTLTNCLGICEHGPVLIVHPEGVKYYRLDDDALERIFQEHMLNGNIVDEFAVSGIWKRLAS